MIMKYAGIDKNDGVEKKQMLFKFRTSEVLIVKITNTEATGNLDGTELN